jgi:hypothetical protein
MKRTHPYFTDKTYGSKWQKLKKEWLIIIKKLCNSEFDSFETIRMGGRKNSLDFKVNYIKDKKIILTKSLEFKFNAESISKIPQILQVYEASLEQTESYSSFYYDNYIKKYIETDTSLCDVEIPDKETYMKLVKKNDYNCHKFFKECYEKESNNKNMKFDVVNESIKKYIEKYGKSFNISKLKEYLDKSQNGKIYILWDLEKFHIDECVYNPNEKLTIKETTHNCIKVKQNKIIFSLLLRWKNHKGILLPAYQISYSVSQ